MADLGTSIKSTDQMAEAIESMVRMAKTSRYSFERKWYDNNFFDDGYHYRYLQRTTNKIVDLSEKSNIYAPSRAIPKASRQIRGMTNLLLSSDPTPVVYPENVSSYNYTNPQEYEQAMQMAKVIAKRTGHWIEEEFKNQNILEQLAQMVLLTCKHGVSYLQIWPDPIKEEIKTQVFDAFDIYLLGYLNDLSDQPFIGKVTPTLIAEIKANENFDEDIRDQITPDNRSASSEIKEAYLNSRFSKMGRSDQAATLLLKEFFVKEYLDENNIFRISQQDDANQILNGKNKGDVILRQTFIAGGLVLRDRYISLPDYPFVDFRLEPGPIYQVAQIERFIPSNKSLDAVVSRVERYTHTMVTGAWLKRRGEQFKPNNAAGGQVIEYDATPPTQVNLAPVPQFVFEFIGLLNSFIEEQGVTTATLGKIPNGVKAASAIESLKESEYSNLVMSSRRLKGTVKRIAEKFLDLADSYFITPQTVYYMEKGEPSYFDIIGSSALKKRQELGIDTPQNVIPLNKEYRVDIQIESGLGYTKEGKKDAAMQLGNFLIQLAQEGYVPPEAVKVFVEKLLETYQFGATQDIMDAMDAGQMMGNMSDNQLNAMKVAMAEVFKDLISEGILPNQDQRIQETKVGVAEAMHDSGIMKNNQQPTKIPSESIAFKDLPPEGQAQMAAQAGININPQQVKQHLQSQNGGQNGNIKPKTT